MIYLAIHLILALIIIATVARQGTGLFWSGLIAIALLLWTHLDETAELDEIDDISRRLTTVAIAAMAVFLVWFAMIWNRISIHQYLVKSDIVCTLYLGIGALWFLLETVCLPTMEKKRRILLSRLTKFFEANNKKQTAASPPAELIAEIKSIIENSINYVTIKEGLDILEQIRTVLIRYKIETIDAQHLDTIVSIYQKLKTYNGASRLENMLFSDRLAIYKEKMLALRELLFIMPPEILKPQVGLDIIKTEYKSDYIKVLREISFSQYEYFHEVKRPILSPKLDPLKKHELIIEEMQEYLLQIDEQLKVPFFKPDLEKSKFITSIDDLITFSFSEQGPVYKKCNYLYDLCKEVSINLQEYLNDLILKQIELFSGLNIESNYENDTDIVPLICSKDAPRSVIENLTSNSVKAGATNIEILVKKENECVIIEFKDNGTGFPDANNFTDKSDWLKRAHRGLIIMKTNLTNYDDNIELVSTGSSGTVFKIIFNIKAVLR
jgi:signal transduction histidine kinase